MHQPVSDSVFVGTDVCSHRVKEIELRAVEVSSEKALFAISLVEATDHLKRCHDIGGIDQVADLIVETAGPVEDITDSPGGPQTRRATPEWAAQKRVSPLGT